MQGALKARMIVPATMAIGGTALTIATLIGQGTGAAEGIAVITVAATVGYWFLGGRHTETGDLAGGRADERVSVLHTEALAFAGFVGIAIALVGFIIQTARNATAWPFELLVCAQALTFVLAFGWLRRRR